MCVQNISVKNVLKNIRVKNIIVLKMVAQNSNGNWC